MCALPKNGCLSMDGTCMDYICFGSGSKTLIMLPGLGDGLRGVRGLALPFSLLYRGYTKTHTVYVFSRKRQLAPTDTTRTMADDLVKAMDLLGIRCADVVGVSHGGMVAQQLAIHYPDRVGKLVLTVTAGRPDPTVTARLSRWMELARSGDHTTLMTDTMRAMYTPRYIKRYISFVPLLSRFTKPAGYDRFLIMARAGIHHDCFHLLPRIHAPTLVIGGEQDQVVSPQASRDLAAAIPGAQLHLFPDYGHSLYDEAPGYQPLVLDFLNRADI